MLSLERGIEADSFLINYGHWHVREMQLDAPKVKWLWGEMQQYTSLFSDLTRNNEKIFISVIQDPFSYWLEIVDDDENIVGVLYLTELYKTIDANMHLIFFDRRPSEKAPLVRDIIKYLFEKFPYLHRITASFPDIYHATLRLAKRVGMIEEGRRREAILIKRKWCNEVIFGILSSDVT